MNVEAAKFAEFKALLEGHCPEDGATYAGTGTFGAYKTTAVHGREPGVDEPAVWLIAQGRKLCHVGEQTYDYRAGNVVIMFYPMTVETEVIEASPQNPFLVAGALLDMGRMADMLLTIDRLDGAPARPVAADPSGIITLPLADELLAPFIRLLKLLDRPRDTAVLSGAILDEIYYRLLTGQRGGELRFLLQQRGEIQRISKAVEHIHNNMDQPVSVEALAGMVHMSRTSFYESFRAVMHVSPLQYAKSLKLHRARSYIQQGKNAGEAAYLVGYNSPAQFSREYKRHFGYSPSATRPAPALPS